MLIPRWIGLLAATFTDLLTRPRTGGGVVRDSSGGVLPGPDARVGRATRRHRRPDRGQELAGPSRPDRSRHRRILRPGMEGDADARAQQFDPRPDQALSRAADRP